MKIIDTRSKENRFEDLKAGDVFMNIDDDCFIKTNYQPNNSVNAVCLDDGSFQYFPIEMTVWKVNAELVIK